MDGSNFLYAYFINVMKVSKKYFNVVTHVLHGLININC